MAAKVPTLLLLLHLSAVFLLMSSTVSGYRGMMVGGRTEVRDVKSDKEVQELGRFCVKEFNKQQQHHHHHQDGCSNGVGALLVFSEVVSAQKQVVSGIKYYLKIETTNGNGETVVCDSVVVVKAWLHEKELVTFEPVANIELRGV
ncbi:hypothetical protein OROGR_008323 [Orobanche gracilis]